MLFDWCTCLDPKVKSHLIGFILLFGGFPQFENPLKTDTGLSSSFSSFSRWGDEINYVLLEHKYKEKKLKIWLHTIIDVRRPRCTDAITLNFTTCRDDDFPFQKIAFSVWENSEFRFKGLSKWKFRLAIDTVHKNSVYKRHTNYESGYFQRVTWSVSHCDIACMQDSPALRDWMIHVRCRTSWPHIACTVQGILRAAMTALHWELVKVRHNS